MLRKIGIGFGIFAAVLFLGGYICLKVKEPSHEDKIKKATSTAMARTASVKEKTIMPKINVVRPDKEIEVPSGVKVAQEKPKGVPARPECYRIIAKIPEKVIKTLNCRGGFIVFNSLNVISAVEVTLKVNQYNNENYYALADEKGDVGFNYAVVEGDLNGQTRSSIKIFALGFIHDENEYVVLECPDVLAPKLSDGIRTICLAPVIGGIRSRESAREILRNECYLDKDSLQLLLPQIEVSQK